MPYYVQELIDHRPTGRVLATAETSAELMHLWQPGVTALCWSAPYAEIRRLSPASLERVRALRHNRRIEAKMPLLAPLFTRPVPPKAGKAGK